MKKVLIFAVIAISFLQCDEVEESFNYIKLTVSGEVNVCRYNKEENTIYMDEGIEGEPVEMSLIKAGGERFEETGLTGKYGQTALTAHFNLYKEQPVKFVAKLVNHPDLLKIGELTWEEVEKSSRYDEKIKIRVATKKIVLTIGFPDDLLN